MLYQSVRLSPRLEPLGQPEIIYCRRCRGVLAPVDDDPDRLRCTSCGTPRAAPRRWRPVEAAPDLALNASAVDVADGRRGAFDWLADLSLAIRAVPVRTRISTAAAGLALCLAGVIAAMVH
ncbi:MAG: hypothetical protein M3R49_07035 [Chloroflexota bacterium]|nr:hypothetical protein [Chloroflexota bacterium]